MEMRDKALKLLEVVNEVTQSDPHFYSGKYCTHLSVNYSFFPQPLSQLFLSERGQIPLL